MFCAVDAWVVQAAPSKDARWSSRGASRGHGGESFSGERHSQPKFRDYLSSRRILEFGIHTFPVRFTLACPASNVLIFFFALAMTDYTHGRCRRYVFV